MNGIDLMELEAFDEDALFERMARDQVLVRSVVVAAREELPLLTCALEAAFTQGNVAGVTHAAHQLVGMLLAISAIAAAKRARGIESSARSADMEAAQAALPELRDELRRTDQALLEHLKVEAGVGG